MTIWPGVTERTTSWPIAFCFTLSVILLHPVGERAHDVERDIGLDQRAGHLPHGFGDIGLGQRAAARELIEDAREAF
jgi:hypothetical protein